MRSTNCKSLGQIKDNSADHCELFKRDNFCQGGPF